jgi:hypothetical protein
MALNFKLTPIYVIHVFRYIPCHRTLQRGETVPLAEFCPLKEQKNIIEQTAITETKESLKDHTERQNVIFTECYQMHTPQVLQLPMLLIIIPVFPCFLQSWRWEWSIQGGAVNRGLFFVGPLPSPLGAVSGSCRRGVRLPPRHHSELCAECQNIKIFEGLSNSKNMVFNLKTLLNIGLGLTLRQKEPMRAE